MSDSTLEANKALTIDFINAITDQDLAAIEGMLNPDFVWITAVASDTGPNEMRRMQSKEMQGKNLPHAKPRLDRDESLAHFRHIFQDYVGNVSERAPDADEDTKFKFTVHNMIAERDYVAMECESYIRNPENNRVYNNFYVYVFRVKNGKLSLYKEYQDTLHMYDYLAD